MPDFDLAHVTGIITPSTAISVLLAGAILGVFLWRTSAHVRSVDVLRGWTIGIAFFAVMAAGRFTDGSAHWEAWLGTMALWSVFVWAGYLAIAAYRRVVCARRPTHQRVNDPCG